jgi:hypothetical protein
MMRGVATTRPVELQTSMSALYHSTDRYPLPFHLHGAERTDQSRNRLPISRSSFVVREAGMSLPYIPNNEISVSLER